jgi:hypothetical protein
VQLPTFEGERASLAPPSLGLQSGGRLNQYIRSKLSQLREIELVHKTQRRRKSGLRNYRETVDKYQVQKKDIFNFDETGIRGLDVQGGRNICDIRRQRSKDSFPL